MKVSACYIVKNEEKNLPVSIDSLKGAADEIVVVDTGSIDETVKIAERCGAKVFHFKWCNDFSAPRNFAIEQADGDWIIFLDADESFLYPKKVRAALEELIAEKTAADAFMLKMYNQIRSEDTVKDMLTAWSCRVFKNRKDLRYKGKIHENIAKDDGNLQLAYGDERLSLLHTGYKIDGIEGKNRRNLEMLLDEVIENGEQPGLWIYFVDCYYGLKDYEKTLYYAKLALDSQAQAVTGRSNIFHKAIEALRSMNGSLDEMLELAEQAIREFPKIPEFYGERGMILCGMGRLAEAKEALLQSVWYFEHPVDGQKVDRYFTRKTAAIIYSRIAEIYMIEGNIELAAEYFDKAISADGNNADILAARNRFLHQALARMMQDTEQGGGEK
ncbi:MAG: glycosyltransferase [Schwartzia sp.]|nr:glycosyltransferase [Schwartzia sp. (in: firmicutes)]